MTQKSFGSKRAAFQSKLSPLVKVRRGITWLSLPWLEGSLLLFFEDGLKPKELRVIKPLLLRVPLEEALLLSKAGMLRGDVG